MNVTTQRKQTWPVPQVDTASSRCSDLQDTQNPTFVLRRKRAKKRLMHCNKQGYSMTSDNEAPVSAQARGDAPAQSSKT